MLHYVLYICYILCNYNYAALYAKTLDFVVKRKNYTLYFEYPPSKSWARHWWCGCSGASFGQGGANLVAPARAQVAPAEVLAWARRRGARGTPLEQEHALGDLA